MALSPRERAELEALRRRAFSADAARMTAAEVDRFDALTARVHQLTPEPSAMLDTRTGGHPAAPRRPHDASAPENEPPSRRRRALARTAIALVAVLLLGSGVALGRASVAWAPPAVVTALADGTERTWERARDSWNWDEGSTAIAGVIDTGLYITGTTHGGQRFCAVRAEIDGGAIPTPRCTRAAPRAVVPLDAVADGVQALALFSAHGEAEIAVSTAVAPEGSTPASSGPQDLSATQAALLNGSIGTAFNDLPAVAGRFEWDERSIRLVGAFGLASVWAGTRDAGAEICIVVSGPRGQQDACAERRVSSLDISERLHQVSPDTQPLNARVRVDEAGFRLLLSAPES